MAQHCAKHKLEGGGEKLARSLAMKWGDIKVVVTKFTSCYKAINEQNLFGKLEDDLICDVRDLYKQIVSNGFVFQTLLAPPLHNFEVHNHLQTNGEEKGWSSSFLPLLISM